MAHNTPTVSPDNRPRTETLEQWERRTGGEVQRGMGGLVMVYINNWDHGVEMIRALWALTDYRVSSVSGPVVRLLPI